VDRHVLHVYFVDGDNVVKELLQAAHVCTESGFDGGVQVWRPCEGSLFIESSVTWL